MPINLNGKELLLLPILRKLFPVSSPLTSHTFESFATWSKTGDVMVFNFAHHDDVTAEGTGMYAPPSWLGFEALQETVTVTELDGKHFDFVRTDDEGHKYIYKFDRTW